VLYSPIDEGKALWQIGMRSQPGSATQIWPLLSKATPQGVAWVGVECPQARRATLATNCRVASTNVELGAIPGTGRDAAVTELRCISAYSDGHGQTGPALILASSVPQVIQIDRPMARRPNRMRRLAKSRHAYHEDSAQQKDQQENSPSSPFYSKQDTCFKRHDLQKVGLESPRDSIRGMKSRSLFGGGWWSNRGLLLQT
jgi:hypothetical protein